MIDAPKLAAEDRAYRSAELERALGQAAARALDAATRMLRASPRDKITIERTGERFTITIESSTHRITYSGGDVQDALSQAMNAFVCDEAADNASK